MGEPTPDCKNLLPAFGGQLLLRQPPQRGCSSTASFCPTKNAGRAGSRGCQEGEAVEPTPHQIKPYSTFNLLKSDPHNAPRLRTYKWFDLSSFPVPFSQLDAPAMTFGILESSHYPDGKVYATNLTSVATADLFLSQSWNFAHERPHDERVFDCDR